MSGDVDDDLARRVADCLEGHLPDYGFAPYIYPSGENKSVIVRADTPGIVNLFDDSGRSWRLEVRRR